MSDKKERSVKEIQDDYTQLCARAGHLQYSISALGDDLRLVNEQLKQLNIEGGIAQKREAEAAKAAASAAPVPTETPSS